MPPSPAGRLEPHARLGPYEIVDLIGAGGMGEVYRARDSRLDRTVAIKVLGASVLDSPLARSRFEREARAISSLSHPHICAVYDVGREGDVQYIVMEHLQGEPLSNRLDRRALRFDQALDLAVQIAGALAAAHRAGIVHRDLKPGNVMVTAQGAKLLDFGLAKQEKPPALRPDVTPDTVTVEGQLVGTLPYMSPEQVGGQPSDARSDIFSFGAMLHEMLTRRRAFEGSQAHLIASILSSDPPPPSTLQPLCPPELDHLVARCLAKDPAERWQSAQDVLLELKWAAARMPPVESPRKRSLRTLGWAAGGAAVAAVAIAVLAAWWVARRASEELPPTASPRRITIAPGLESAPSLSPDGGLVAFGSDEAGSQDIWIVDGRGGNAIQLTDDPASDVQPAWLPDGSALLFTSDRGGAKAIWRVLRFGGAPSPVAADAEDPAVSFDGSRLAFARAGPDGKARIWVAPMDDPARARVVTGDDDGFWDHREPAFSPDGRTLCYRALRDLWLVPVDGGAARRLTVDDEADIEPAWSPDGRFVYFSSFRGGAWALWRVPAAGGTPRRLTDGTGGERHPSLSRDGKRLALATFSDRREIRVLDLATRKEVPLPGSNPSAFSWAPDGRSLVFAAARIGGRYDLWIQSIDPKEPAPPRRLTDHAGSASSPAVSPDGRWVAYYRVLDGQRDIWIVPAAGGSPLRFTNDAATDVHPAWSPDGRQLAFSSDRSGASRIWVAPVDSGRPAGEARALTTGPTTDQWPVWSPDGRWIAYVGGGPANEGANVWVVDSASGAPACELRTEGRAGQAGWESDSKTLLVTGTWESGVTLRRFSAASGMRIALDPPVRLGENPDLYAFSVSRNGRSIAFRRSEVRGDVWTLESLDRRY